MNERYDRSACERITPSQHRNSEGDFGLGHGRLVCLPETVAGSDRIGEEPKVPAKLAPVVDTTPSGSPLSPSAQDSTQVEGAPLEDVTLADTSPDTLPKEAGA